MNSKRITAVLFVMCSITSGRVSATSADDYLAEGRAALFNGRISGLTAAYDIFDACLNDTACVDCQASRELIFMHVVTRIAMWALRDDGPPIDSAVEFGREYGVRLSGDLYGGLAVTGLEDLFPLNEHDSYHIPEDGPAILADFLAFRDRVAVDEVTRVLEELNRITETPQDRFRMFFTPQETAMFYNSPEPVLTNDIEVDYGEVLLLKGALSALSAILRSRAAYDLHVEPEDMLIEKMYGECFSINNDLLLPHPDFLKLLPTDNDPNDGAAILAQARQDWIRAINDYLTAIEYILSEDDPPGSDPQEDELLFLAGSDLRAIKALDGKLRELLSSLENDEPGTFTYEKTDSYSLWKDDAPIGSMELVSEAWGDGEDGLMALQYCGCTPSQWEIEDWDIEDGMIYAELEGRTSELGYEFLEHLDSANSVLFTPVECPGMIPCDYEMLDSCLFEATGSPQGWKSSYRSWSYVLPFDFPFYGTTYNSVYVSVNGFLDFADSSYPYWYFPDRIRIQPLGEYLRTDRQPEHDVYIDAADETVTFRWKADYYGWEYNFSATLFRDGRIRFDYGPGNYGGWPYIGISNGDESTAIRLGQDGYFWGFLFGTVDEASGSITNATFEFWGSRSGLIENISAEVTGTAMLQEVVDPNPVFGSSPRYPNPVSPRDLLPVFDAWNAPLPGTLGNGLGQDATLGGILPEMTHERWRDDLDLQPAANLDWEPVEAWQLVGGWVGLWKPEQLVLDDATGDIPERYAAIGGLDVTTLHLGHDSQYLYGSLALHNPMVPDGNYDFGVALSPDPHDLDAMDTVEAHIRVDVGVIDAAVMHHTRSPDGYDEWEEISGVEVISAGNRLDFRIPLEAMSDYLNGRFVSVTSVWNWSDVDENYTHIRMGRVGTIRGTVTYDAYDGAPIFVQAYLDPREPEDSVIAATMITEPGPYVLEGIGVDWRGYVRAFTPLFGFNVLNMDALEIEKSVRVVMNGGDAEGVDIVLENPPVLERNVPVAGEIDTELNRWDIYAIDCVKGGHYTLELTRLTAQNAFMILLARDGNDELTDNAYDNSQPLTWQCERTGTYYVEVEEYWWHAMGGTYQIRFTSEPVICPDANLKAAVDVALGTVNPTPEDMGNLTTLHASSQGIRDLTGLEFAVNLEYLDLSGNQISDISPLAGLRTLRYLDLRSNPLDDLACSWYVPQILANNPGIELLYDEPGKVEGRIYVDWRAPAGGDGSTWLNAFKYLQDALPTAQAGDSIWVASGTYRPDQGAHVTPGDRTATFQLKSGVALYGGFRTGTFWPDRNPQQYETVLGGDLGGDDGQGNIADNSYHVVTANGAGLSAVLDGFTIRGGNGDLAGMKGGGLLCVFGGATLRNCVIEHNRATCAAAIDCRDSSLSLEDVIVRSNIAPSNCHAAFSRSTVNIQGLVSVAGGQINTYASQFYGPGAVEIAPTAEWIVNNAEPCGARIITNIYGGVVEPTTIYLSPFGGWKGQWWIPGAALWNTVVAGEDTAWCIAPYYGGYPAIMLWYGNELTEDLSTAAQAEARFRAGGELLIYGELYDGVDWWADLLYDGLLLWAEVGPMRVRGSDNQLSLAAPVEVTPLGGFLAANDAGLQMSGVQLMNLALGYCVQRNGPVRNFARDIETTSESTLSMVASGLPQAVTTMACEFVGSGAVDIQAGAELRLDGGLMRLRDQADRAGSMSIDGKLVAVNGATVGDTEIAVHSASYVAGSDVHRKGVGGEFYVQGAATITGNTIVAEGDRYLDFDLAHPQTPTVSDNRFVVTIPAEARSEQGTLLELRGRDAHCGEAANPDCGSGAYRVVLGNDFEGEPADNWILGRLELLGAARLNLTDRRGFEYNGQGQREAVYVRQLVLGPDSVLNTALQTLYYEDLILVDSRGNEIERNPADLSVPFVNGSRIIDIPLLGFSLKIIDMNDPTPPPNNEFDIRVDFRLTDASDRAVVGDGLPLPRGEVLRIPDARGAGDGVMEMATYGPDEYSAASVAAKGAFARAADESIVVEFDYQFVEVGPAGAEIIVYLSDDADVSENLVEIARIRPLTDGWPGGVGSQYYGLFSGTFARGHLNFTRGTYVELELRGKDSRCRIDNWDPAVECDRPVCGDYTDPRHVATIEDYLLLLSHFGMTLTSASDKGCLDLNKDGFIGIEDLAAWNIVDGGLNLCNAWASTATKGLPAPEKAGVLKSGTTSTVGAYEPLVFSGQPAGNQYQTPDNYLYAVRTNGLVRNARMMLEPGRLAADHGGHVYLNQGHRGPVDAETSQPKLPSGGVLVHCGGAMVRVGVNEQAEGLPITDIAVAPADPNTLYVVPVLVTPAGGSSPYRAAAKLVFADGPNGQSCSIGQLYGMDPQTYSSHVFSASDSHGLHNPDFEHVSEIELDAAGHVLLLSTHGYSDNKWLLIFEEDDANAMCGQVNLGDLGIDAPTAMLASSVQPSVYLTARASKSETPGGVVYRLDMSDQGGGQIGLSVAAAIQIAAPAPTLCSDLPLACNGQYVTAITSLAENPDDGTLYAVGFTIPRLAADEPQWQAIVQRGIFATPFLAEIPPDGSAAITRLFTDSGPTAPVLPMSVLWTGGRPPCGGADITGDGMVRLEDFARLASQWLADNPDLLADIAAERRYDGEVDIHDLVAFIDCWLRVECR